MSVESTWLYVAPGWVLQLSYAWRVCVQGLELKYSDPSDQGSYPGRPAARQGALTPRLVFCRADRPFAHPFLGGSCISTAGSPKSLVKSPSTFRSRLQSGPAEERSPQVGRIFRRAALVPAAQVVCRNRSHAPRRQRRPASGGTSSSSTDLLLGRRILRQWV